MHINYTEGEGESEIGEGGRLPIHFRWQTLSDGEPCQFPREFPFFAFGFDAFGPMCELHGCWLLCCGCLFIIVCIVVRTFRPPAYKLLLET